jgi:hypothetical protein
VDSECVSASADSPARSRPRRYVNGQVRAEKAGSEHPVYADDAGLTWLRATLFEVATATLSLQQ